MSSDALWRHLNLSDVFGPRIEWAIIWPNWFYLVSYDIDLIDGILQVGVIFVTLCDTI